jgi:heme-degrading monooxygenase HmoA
MFQSLLNEVKPYFSDSSEWKVQLSKDLKLEYQSIPEEPVIKSYATLAHSQEKLPDKMMYLRVVSHKIQTGKMEKFKEIYSNEILPTLRSVKGCRYAYLTMGGEDKNEAISITIWDSKQDADAYEKSGVFRELLEKARPTYSELYQWKMALEQNKKRHMITSDDVSVKYYSVLSVKGFQ